MAKLTWIIFGVLVAYSSAHFGIGRNGPQFQQRQNFNQQFRRAPQALTKPLGVNVDEKKCFTLARRPFYVSRFVHYPCDRQQQGVPVIRWYMGQYGPVCVSYFREPIYRYFRIPMCCPGYVPDRAGKCTIKTPPSPMRNNMQANNNGKMMAMASQMRQAMWLRAKQDMERRRAMFFMNMRDNQRAQNNRPMIMPGMQQRRPPMAPMLNMYRPPQGPSVGFLRFNRPTQPMPPMPHPVQQPPLSGRVVRIIRRKIIPLFPLMRRSSSPEGNNQIQFRPPMVPRIVLSGRMNTLPMTIAREFHPASPQQPRIEPPFQRLINPHDFPRSGFPEAPEPQQAPIENNQDGFHDHSEHSSSDGFHIPLPGESSDGMMQVDLPSEPVQMPELVVEQAPMSGMDQGSCIVKLEAAVKQCLKQNNIDVPDVMSAFEPFNDDKSRVLCEAEDSIFNCITETLKDCNQSNDAEIARGMLLETAQTVQSMCEIRQASVASRLSQPESASSMQGADTVSTVENVDAIPTDVNAAAPTPDNEEITIIEENQASPDAPTAESVKEAIQHEVHVQEMRMKEYLLPILVGSGVGFMMLVLFISLIMCCCCKRKLKKKMRLAKELEKPPLKDGIYTIGVAPPTYEVNGIPPMYYEEAKGEKITSRSPAVLEGTDQAREADGTQM